MTGDGRFDGTTAPHVLVTPERWQRIQELFDGAMELPVEERGAFLSRECGDDGALHDEIESLLASSPQASESLRQVVEAEAERLAGKAAIELIGTRVGPYELRSLLGEGGMGAVFLGAHTDDESRTVAIKILQRGVGPNAAARFRDERQILAALDHPGIVKLLDGGHTPQGQPYLVMEHISGTPIAAHARQAALSIAGRVELVIQVCAAVHYAHGRLVVHRDIKPNNLLVTADGTPKLLDFGIAKLLDADTPREARTLTGTLLYTPAYASPEQVLGEPVSVATDVYALGAVLYELLTLRPPLPLPANAADFVRVIAEQAPPPPSSVASAGRAELAGDLDRIVLRALAKDPGQRHASAAELADDLVRWGEA